MEDIDPAYRALVFVGAYGGLRWQEAAGLRLSDFDALHGRLSVTGTIERGEKGAEEYVPAEAKTSGSRRTIDVPAPLVSALSDHIAQHESRDGFVFEMPAGGFLKYSNFRRRYWMPAVRAAGLAVDETEDSAGLGYHELRHTAAALLIDDGADPLTVQQYLGHDDIKTTMSIYGHLFPRRGKEMAASFGAAIEKARAAASVLPEFPKTA
jgi:integrase